MILFDLILLIAVSVTLGMKSLFLGAMTLVIGFLIGFQNLRTTLLLGSPNGVPSGSRKIKSLILAILIGACALPFVIEMPTAASSFEKTWTEESVLPVIVVIGLFAAAMMAALTVEKRKR